MARFPGAIWKPIDSKYLPNKKLVAFNRVNLHVAVSESDSIHGYFSQPLKGSSHFYVRKDGEVEQYVDTAYRAEADLEGNDATISIETQGGLKNAQSEPWTDAQIETLAKIYAWAVETHGIEKKIASDSKIGSSSWGLSWHRLGVNGNFPELPDVRAGRIQRGGGMRYSVSRGKVCPGDAKIRQVEDIFDRAMEILSGGGESEKPSPKPEKPETKPEKPSSGFDLDEDGKWGSDTTRALQEIFKTPKDGKVSSQAVYWKNENPGLTTGWEWVSGKTEGSQLLYAIQRKLGFTGDDVDGLIGPNTIKALQRRYKTPIDGEVWNPSSMVKAMQKKINDTGKF